MATSPRSRLSLAPLSRADLCPVVIDNLELIDFRKVDKSAIVDLSVTDEKTASDSARIPLTACSKHER
jgi:hypothetical protein